jgi:hypothetical protein
MRTGQWNARYPSWDAEPPDETRLFGPDRFLRERLNLPDVVIRRVRTAVEQYRDVIAPYAAGRPRTTEGQDGATGHF